MSDPNPRLTTCHFAILDPGACDVFVADKQGTVVILSGTGISLANLTTVQTRHKSFNKNFEIHLPSPVMRIKWGILRGPPIGNVRATKRPTLITVGLDGSIGIIQVSDRLKFDILLCIHRIWRSSYKNYWIPGMTNLSMLIQGHWMLRMQILRGIH
jgi:hypothetical protein